MLSKSTSRGSLRECDVGEGVLCLWGGDSVVCPCVAVGTMFCDCGEGVVVSMSDCGDSVVCPCVAVGTVWEGCPVK